MNIPAKTMNRNPMSNLGCMLQTPDWRETEVKPQRVRWRFWIALCAVVILWVLR